MLRINRIIKDSKVNGPGTRYTIWLQGCSIHCDGCSNTDTWNPEKGYSLTIKELVEDIQRQKIDGITLTGGEPLDQFPKVIDFLKQVFPSYNILLTSGYTLEKIKKDFPETLQYVDILVDGPFIIEQLDTTATWRGSTNQNINYLTERSKQFINYKPKFRTEIKIDKKTGETIVTGFSIPEILKERKHVNLF